jgi:tRNA-specific 2-thiouridylase
MSGGVDSSVTAAILAEQGFDVVGLTMRIAPHMAANEQDAQEGHCAPDLLEAKRVAELLGIEHHQVDLIGAFDEEIISNFAAEYAAGRTPNPCMRCNRTIKFGRLFAEAQKLGGERMATGHYARIERRSGRSVLRCAVDPKKDQSYFLAALTRDDLERAVFPLGETHKHETRAIARRLDLPNADKPGSKEVCFAPDADYARFLEDRLGKPRRGPIVSTSGDVLGEHKGLIHYTIGQRRGLGIAAERPLYVVRKEAGRNQLVVGVHEEVFSEELTAAEANWTGIHPPAEPVECSVKIRYNQAPLNCTVLPVEEEGRFRVRFHEPVSAVAPGQWAVLYEGEYVLASGIIASAVPADAETAAQQP